MRERLLLIAERIRRKATDYEPDMPSEAELLRDIAECIEEVLASENPD